MRWGGGEVEHEIVTYSKMAVISKQP
jgi:hypothetical protein